MFTQVVSGNTISGNARISQTASMSGRSHKRRACVTNTVTADGGQSVVVQNGIGVLEGGPASITFDGDGFSVKTTAPKKARKGTKRMPVTLRVGEHTVSIGDGISMSSGDARRVAKGKTLFFVHVDGTPIGIEVDDLDSIAVSLTESGEKTCVPRPK